MGVDKGDIPDLAKVSLCRCRLLKLAGLVLSPLALVLVAMSKQCLLVCLYDRLFGLMVYCVGAIQNTLYCVWI